jgi:membrane associated rhomboid family serine protease
MLILPMERTFDIRRPPVVTFLLLILNVIVFLATSGSDEEKLLAAVGAYEDQQILETELPLFQAYLKSQSDEADRWTQLDSADELDGQDRFYLAMQMLTDREYSQYLERNTDWFTWEQMGALEKKGEIVETYIDQLVYLRYGFMPADFSFLTLFSSQFLHGDLFHLIGNMVILVLIGLTVEQLLGSFNFLLFYLLSGAIGSAVYGLAHLGSPVVLVGASGAISGLMGMYVAAYGKRPIRFFYWIGVYFNYVKLPALLMLPVWVGKEIFDFLFTDSNVAYSAHAGGLVAGAAFVLVGKSSFARIDTEIIENRDRDLEYREDLEYALQLVDHADFPAARGALLRLLESYPGDSRALFQLVQLEKTKPATKDYHLATFNYLKSVLPTGSLSKDTLGVVRDYWSSAAPRPRIRGQIVSKLINKLIAVGELSLAETICKSAEEHELLDADTLREANAYRLEQLRSRGS